MKKLTITSLLVVLLSATTVWADKFEDILRRADQGDALSQFDLGEMYYHGHFVQGQSIPKDYTMAVKWFRLAALQGHAAAQYNLGVRYANGRGVPQPDVIEAYMWFTLAVAQGDPDALVARDRIAMGMTPDQIAQGQKLAQEWRPTRKVLPVAEEKKP
ncbi:MAG: sel1 repeat family protein [Magnetococcales bacterium]|nr:sel1 repeat family protein [Magnetococcales bacterium]